MHKITPKKTRRGDTLIEILFATAIFGAISITTVSLVNSTLALAEGNLEQTVTRSAIDAQAEAIRYLHSAYTTERDSATSSALSDAWTTITKNALDPTKDTTKNQISNFPVTTCPSKDSSDLNQAFIVDTNHLSSDKVIYQSSVFTEASVYPRLTYNTDGSLSSAEGLWNLVVKSDGTTDPEYYDFYIRSCWYTPSSSAPTTLGTVIRLRNPDYSNTSTDSGTAVDPNTEYTVTITLDAAPGTFSNGAQTTIVTKYLKSSSSLTLSSVVDSGPTRTDGYILKGWTTKYGKTYTSETSIPFSVLLGLDNDSNLTNGIQVSFTAVWDNPVKITYNCNGATEADRTVEQPRGEEFSLDESFCTRQGYKFIGWSKEQYEVGEKDSYNSSNRLAANTSYTATQDTSFYAVWAFDGFYKFQSKQDSNYVIDIALTPAQLDSITSKNFKSFSGAGATIYPSHSEDNQKFKLQYNTEGDYYNILWDVWSRYKGKYKDNPRFSLDAHKANNIPDAGQSMALEICADIHSKANQRWTIERYSNNSYYIALADPYSDFVVDNNSCVLAPSNGVSVYYNRNTGCGAGGNHQRWSLKYVGS